MNEEDYHSPDSISSYLDPRLGADLISIDDEANQTINDADGLLNSYKK